MARRITFRHPVPRAHWLAPEEDSPTIKLGTWHELENALGRTLNDNEREAIARALGVARFWRAQTHRSASAEDTKATLRALAKIASTAAPEAFERCDAATRAHLFDSLLALGVPGHRAIDATGAEIKAAAVRALAQFRPLPRGPRRTWRRCLAGDAIYLWRNLGGKGYAPAAKEGYATPLVRFAAALFAEVEPKAARSVAGLLATLAKEQRDK